MTVFSQKLTAKVSGGTAWTPSNSMDTRMIGMTRVPAFVEDFMLRVQDVIDQYNPDLLYFDDNCDWSFDARVPGRQRTQSVAGDAGAHSSDHGVLLQRKHPPERGQTGGSIQHKNRASSGFEHSGSGLRDEPGRLLQPYPWQTDTCIGGWHYSRAIFEQHRYRTPESMVHLLVDVVSKNGNLLLNIPLPGDGRPDSDELAFLEAFGRWMALNGESIYSTRPWKIYGEGPTTGPSNLCIRARYRPMPR